MKNGLFNYIHGIAFCFVLSIICLFGPVDIFAHTDNEIIDNFNKIHVDIDGNYFIYSNEYTHKFELIKIVYGNVYVKDDDSLISIVTDDNKLIRHDTYTCSYGSSKFDYFGRSQNQSNLFLNSEYKLVYSSFPIYYESGGLYNKFLIKQEEPTPKYDSTLGYLTNVKVKRASPFLLTDMSTDFTNIIDRFSWGAVTSGGSSFDGVDIRIKTFKNEDILGEVEKHINCPPNNYKFDWGNYIDLSLKDWVLGNLFRYEIYLRPTFGNKYGDYCYFNVGFPTSVNEQIEATLDPKYLTDTIQYVENVGYIDNFDNYSPPTDSTTLFVPNYVVPNKPIDDINKDLDDDNVVPPSSPSYTEITNNITIIQNGNENGSSLLDKLGDLLSFFTNFLTFLYNFINLILSSLSFLPSWVKSLLSMSIIAFIVICIIKTVRG